MVAEGEPEPGGTAGSLPQVDLRGGRGVQVGSGPNIQFNYFRSGPVAGIGDDVQRLHEITRAVLDGNRDEVTIPAPEGMVAIQRDVAALAMGAEGGFALIGEPGAGKSVLAAIVADALLKAGEDVVFLGAESLAASLGATRAELGLQNNLDQVLTAWDGQPRGTLIIDGVDATRGTSAGPRKSLRGSARRFRGVHAAAGRLLTGAGLATAGSSCRAWRAR